MHNIIKQVLVSAQSRYKTNIRHILELILKLCKNNATFRVLVALLLLLPKFWHVSQMKSKLVQVQA